MEGNKGHYAPTVRKDGENDHSRTIEKCPKLVMIWAAISSKRVTETFGFLLVQWTLTSSAECAFHAYKG